MTSSQHSLASPCDLWQLLSLLLSQTCLMALRMLFVNVLICHVLSNVTYKISSTHFHVLMLEYIIWYNPGSLFWVVVTWSSWSVNKYSLIPVKVRVVFILGFQISLLKNHI